MKKFLTFLSIVLIASFTDAKAGILSGSSIENPTAIEDPTRLAELDQFWKALSKTVKDGDYEGYGALYHSDAVVVFAGGANKTSVPISTALANWKQGFQDTKDGKQKDNVEFRFSQRIGNDETAHETGIFHFTSVDENGRTRADSYTHFEMLFVKKGGKWLSIMEYQKSPATKAEWDALQ